MYRCTDCNKEYEELPGYCECGNDNFEEVSSQTAGYDAETEYYDEPEYEEPAFTQAEIPAAESEKKERMKTVIAACVILLLCILVFVIPPHRKVQTISSETKQEEVKVQLPSVQTYWDDSVPSAFRKNDPIANLPLLNAKFGSIPPSLREYLVNIGRYFNNGWDTRGVTGAGSCKVLFVINKEGGLSTKKIVSSSGNQNLDDSVSLLLTNTTGFNIPPDGYKGERIYITFTINQDGTSKVSYPSK